MDRKLPENPEIRRLIELSEHSRRCLESEVSALKHKRAFPPRGRVPPKQTPVGGRGGSLAPGPAASLWRPRNPAVDTKRKGIPATLLGLTLTAARPLAKVWLANQVKQWAAGTTSSIPAPGLLSPRSSNHSNSP